MPCCAVLSVSVMVVMVRMSASQFTRDSLYHAMNDRGVYLPDDYNSDLPPAQGAPVPVDMKMRVLQIAKVDDDYQTMTVEMAIGLAWIEPRLLFNNIFDWEERRSVKTNEKLIEHLWAPNLHFLSTEKLERISTLKNSGSVTIYRNGTVQFDSHVRITVGREMLVRRGGNVLLAGTCFMSFKNYPIDEQLCRVLSVAHANSIHEVVLRGSISYNTEFQRPLQYNLELRHLPDNYTFMVMEDTMYSVQGFEVKLQRKILPSLTKFYIPTQLMVALSWLAFFVPPEVISGRMVLLVILLLMLTNVGKYVNRKTITFTAQYTFSLSCVCGGKYSLEFKLHGGPHLAAGLSDSDHRQYRPVCLRPLHYGQGGEGEGERGPGAASVSPVSAGRLHCRHRLVSLPGSV